MLDSSEFPLARPPFLLHLLRSVAGYAGCGPSFGGIISTIACPTAWSRTRWDFGHRPFPAGLAAGLPPVAPRLSRLPRMELLRMQRVSDSVGRCAASFPGPTVATGRRLFSLFPPGFPAVPHYLDHTTVVPCNRYPSCCLPHICIRSTLQRCDFGAPYLACVSPRQRFAAPLRVADA